MMDKRQCYIIKSDIIRRLNEMSKECGKTKTQLVNEALCSHLTSLEEYFGRLNAIK